MEKMEKMEKMDFDLHNQLLLMDIGINEKVITEVERKISTGHYPRKDLEQLIELKNLYRSIVDMQKSYLRKAL